LSDRYDNYGFVSLDNLDSSLETEEFWSDFAEVKRFEQTYDEDESEEEDWNMYNLEPEDIYYMVDEFDWAVIQPDDEIWNIFLIKIPCRIS
jgi:hypothetical protein